MGYIHPTDTEIDKVVSQLEMSCHKSAAAFRIVKRAKRPLLKGQIQQLATAFKMSRFTIGNAAAVADAFDECPQLRDKWERQILEGRVDLNLRAAGICREAKKLMRIAATKSADSQSNPQ